MKKVLIVSYVFPPMGAVGGRRIVGFCKFLPQFGWKPVVLTVKGGVNSSWDYESIKNIPETIVYRARSFEPLAKREMRQMAEKQPFEPPDKLATAPGGIKHLSILARIKRFIRLLLSVPDFAILWIPFGVLKGLSVIRKEKIDCIMSSSPPVSAHILAAILSRLSGRPHLVDFRDLWTLNHNYDLRNYPNYFMKYDKFWERFVLKRASRVITASPGFTDQMENHLGGFLRGKVSTITNGFDYSGTDLNANINQASHEKLKFLYTGSLYGHFNPVFLMESMADWVKMNNVSLDKIQIDFFGNSDRDYNELAKNLGLEKSVQFHGFKPQNELHSYFQETDFVILLLGFRREYKNVVPAKIFEYLASGKKILALAPKGVTTDLIDKYNAGIYLTLSDKIKMIETLNAIYQEWLKNPAETGRLRYIEEIDRKILTGKLADILETIMSGHIRPTSKGYLSV
jgi:glycosyltransferase involved in cell wall biosynthesis